MALREGVFRIEVVDRPLDGAALTAEVGRPEAGGIVVFSGTARNHSPGKERIEFLEYDAYGEHVERKIAEICREAGEKWPVVAGVVEHRVGRVEIGEPSVIVAVATAHRDDAFAAARYVIDELKGRAPIWKREHWPGGAEWVEGA